MLVEKGWDPAMGARPLRRAIQRYIEDPLADFVLREKVIPGATVVVAPAPDGEEGEVRLTIVKPKKQKTPVAVGAEGASAELGEGDLAEGEPHGGEDLSELPDPELPELSEGDSSGQAPADEQ